MSVNVREQIAEAITPHLNAQGINVLAYTKSPDNILGPLVMVRLDTVTPSTQPQAWRLYEVVLVVLTELTTPGRADDGLDAVLEEVLFAIDKAALPTWTTARRAVFDETYPGYEVTLTVPITKED